MSAGGVGRVRKSRGRRRGAPAQPTALVALLVDGGPKSRRASAQLERMGGRAVPALLRAYDSPHEHLRWEVVNLLGYLKDRRALPLLLERAIHDSEIHPRWRSIWALSSVDDGSVVARLRAQLTRSRGRRRRNIAVALSIFEDPAAVPVLRHGLEAKDTWTRWESVSCLAGYGDRDVAQDVLRLYRKERDPGIRREMIRALAGVDGQAVFRFLARRLSDPDPDLRAAAALALTKMDDAPRAHRVLRRRFDRENARHVVRVLREALAALDGR